MCVIFINMSVFTSVCGHGLSRSRKGEMSRVIGCCQLSKSHLHKAIKNPFYLGTHLVFMLTCSMSYTLPFILLNGACLAL